MPKPPHESADALLRQVSRSFYLTLRVLPGDVRPQISLAYLLARATDTIADTEAVGVHERLAALDAWAEAISNPTASRASLPPGLTQVRSNQGTPAERSLLERAEGLLASLDGQPTADQQDIRLVLQIITGGQRLDLQRFGHASRENLQALASDAELDDYTYRVAGCVGEFWTKLCLRHRFQADPRTTASLMDLGSRFGKGLQLVNILRDVGADLRLGRCYLPADRLALAGMQPRDLLHSAAETRFRTVYDGCLGRAHDHLTAGWAYTSALPRNQLRLRCACAWPILIGVRTLAQLKTANPLDGSQRVKISRREVRSIILRTVLLLPWHRSWEQLFRRASGPSPRPGPTQQRTPAGTGSEGRTGAS